MTSERLDFIDALRGIGALYITVFHMAFIANLLPTGQALHFVVQGGSAVMLFYLISGFCLCFSMENNRSDRPGMLKKFYISRFFRIAPLFYFSIGVAWIRSKYWFPETLLLQDVFSNLLFIFNFIPGKEEGIVWASWALSVEMVFYLIFPLIYSYARKGIRNAVQFLAFSLVLMFLYHCLFPFLSIEESLRPQFLRFSFLRYLPIFALGILIYHVWNGWFRYNCPPRSAGNSIILIVLIAFIDFFYNNLYSFPNGILWISVVYGVLILGLSVSPVRLIVNRTTCFFGKISYSIYLNHPIVILLLVPWYGKVYRLSWPLGIKFIFCWFVTLFFLTFVSFLTYQIVEKPGIQIGKAFIGRR